MWVIGGGLVPYVLVSLLAADRSLLSCCLSLVLATAWSDQALPDGLALPLADTSDIGCADLLSLVGTGSRQSASPCQIMLLTVMHSPLPAVPSYPEPKSGVRAVDRAGERGMRFPTGRTPVRNPTPHSRRPVR